MIDLVIRLGWQHNKWLVVLRDYEGPRHVCPALMAKIEAHLNEHKHKDAIISEFDHVEILGCDRRKEPT